MLSKQQINIFIEEVNVMKKLFFVCLVLFLWVGSSFAGPVGDVVEVSIVSDNGQYLPFYPVKSHSALKKVYTEATKGDHYRVIVRNKLGRRVGVVVAVDGRNIISGKKSWLKSNEKMYVLEPYATNEYSGWRTAQDKINRFYFTDVPDSYAAAFGDESAMGVIAVVAYPEIHRYEPQLDPPFVFSEKKSGAARERAAPSAESMDQAGTGYGREEYSPSYRVSFDPEKRPAESILIKYEWHKTLCDLKIIDCCRSNRYSQNRIWDNDGFAPPPPCLFCCLPCPNPTITGTQPVSHH